MKKSIYKNKTIPLSFILGTIGILFFVYSCELTKSLDDITPLYQLTEESTFTDAEKTEAVLTGVYTAWKAGTISEFTSQTMMLSGNYQTSGSDVYENNVEITNTYLSGYYEEYYALIQRANYLIEAMQSDLEIPGLSSERRVEIEAEARLHRAMAHFFLLRNFGQFYDTSSEYGIMISDVSLSGPINIARSSVQESYNFILDELDYALENAPETATVGRLTKYVAKAMKAKVLLYTEEWASAASLALEVINSGVYELETDFKDLYTEGYTSGEVIFSPISIFPYSLSFGGNGTYSFGPTLQTVADESVGTSSDGNLVSGEGFDPRFAYAHASSTLPAGVYNNKYPFITMTTGDKGPSHFILRLGEMYLIYAEAKARSATGTTVDADALTKLNDIRVRAGLLGVSPTTKSELLEDIRIEKHLELFAEFNEPWFDIVRYHILGDINISDIKSSITSNDQLILPYPSLALSGNGGLVQNPGYPY